MSTAPSALAALPSRTTITPQELAVIGNLALAAPVPVGQALQLVDLFARLQVLANSTTPIGALPATETLRLSNDDYAELDK